MTTDPLYSFQEEAIERITQEEPIYLGFDPGLGKSRTALEGAYAAGARRILVLCPAIGRYVWTSETRKWLSKAATVVRLPSDLQRGPGIFVLTYGLVSQRNNAFGETIAKGQPYDVTVLDEAHALKNPGANRTKAVFGTMLPKLGYVLPLSGTPAPNHAGELFTILRALYPQAAVGSNGKPMNQWEFEERYCRVTSKRFGNGPSVRVIEGSRNIPELKARMSGFMMRVKKGEVLKELPPIRYDVIPLGVKAPPDLPKLPVFKSDAEMLAYLNGRGTTEPIARLRHMLGICKAGPAAEYVDDFLQNVGASKKVLVFAHHKAVVDELVQGLADWGPVAVTGASTTAERAAAINAFLTNRQCRVFIGNIQASGTGITLVGPTCDCSDVFFVEADYSVGNNVQAAARVHRIGQREAVVARFLTAHNTIDDAIQGILARKAKDFAALFN
jgi:SNF2 family DNA or RNA helicase